MIVTSPNLPKNRVKNVLIGTDNQIIHEYFTSLGVEVIVSDELPALGKLLSSHVDLQVFHMGGDKLLVSDETQEFISKLHVLGFQIESSKAKLLEDYPHNIPLNAAYFGKFVVANTLYVDPVIRNQILNSENIQAIHVKQGYARCSTAIVNENAIITADHDISKHASLKGIDVLLISQGDILLPGFSYGFIGGASMKLSATEILFFGELEKHQESKKIVEFLYKHGVSALSINGMPLTDIGGGIPLTE